jgi:carbonic anhydrase
VGIRWRAGGTRTTGSVSASDRIGSMTDSSFADVLAANRAYADDFKLAGLEPQAARGLAILTCMDSRIEPLALLGLVPGDAKILRNAGARVTDDVLRTLVLAVHLLGVNRVLVVPHLKCRMTAEDEATVHRAIFTASGVDTRSLELRPAPDVVTALMGDLQRIRSSPYLPADLAVGGAVYDVDTGRLQRFA